jgi:hypothetical protein
VNCREPYPWATRADRIDQLKAILDLETSLSKSDKLLAGEAIDELTNTEESQNPKSRIGAGERIKRLAPQMWTIAQPVLAGLLSAELKAALGIL